MDDTITDEMIELAFQAWCDKVQGFPEGTVAMINNSRISKPYLFVAGRAPLDPETMRPLGTLDKERMLCRGKENLLAETQLIIARMREAHANNIRKKNSLKRAVAWLLEDWANDE